MTTDVEISNLARATDIRLPEVVTVLAPGPAGRDYWDKACGCIIAVNRAVQIPVCADWWIVADGKAVGLDWFEWGCEHFRGKIAFSGGVARSGCAREADYVFNLCKMDWDHKGNKPVEYEFRQDYFRGTESVSGIAIEFACRYGARLVRLIGVDLAGGYYDDPDDDLYTRIPCIFRETIPLMMKYWRGRGVEFEVVSPSALRMELSYRI